MLSQVAGYVLAGGKSSRMGQDKALLELAGKSLVALAVEKLRRVCEDVHILSSRPELEMFAPLVPDVHPGCGPLGGIEAALLHSPYEWNLFLPVDMPFVPASFLEDWVREVLATEARVALFTVDGRAQPTLCLLHRDVTPFAQQAMAQGEHKLWPVLEGAARELAARSGVALDQMLWNRPVEANAWFANLNTPEEFAAAALGFVPPIYT